MFARLSTQIPFVAALASVCLSVHSVHAAAPPGRYTTTSLTVYDARTALTWQRAVPDGLYGRSAAISYCADLSLAGASDWRLPSLPELRSLVDRTEWAPAIDATAFPDTPYWYYWANSQSPAPSRLPSFVDFNEGQSGFITQQESEFHVRCVRGG
jgi:hypothetical protein